MKNKQLFILVTLIAIVIWCYNGYLIKKSLDNKRAFTELSSSNKDFLFTPKLYNSQLRDPFQIASDKVVEVKRENVVVEQKVVENVEPPILSINGIMWDAVSPTAILVDGKTGEDHIVSKNTEWGEIKVVEIKQSSVRIVYKGKEFEIK